MSLASGFCSVDLPELQVWSGLPGSDLPCSIFSATLYPSYPVAAYPVALYFPDLMARMSKKAGPSALQHTTLDLWELMVRNISLFSL